jgi:hypothetical protein
MTTTITSEKAENMYRVFVTEVVRPMMQTMFPDVENERSDNNPYEHPMTAVGIVLMSAAAIGTIDSTTLAHFTGYSRPFLLAITFNMENNHLWVDGRYDTSTWLLSDGPIDADGLWEHIDIACGTVWMPTADSNVSTDPCGVFWDERGGLSEWEATGGNSHNGLSE